MLFSILWDGVELSCGEWKRDGMKNEERSGEHELAARNKAVNSAIKNS